MSAFSLRDRPVPEYMYAGGSGANRPEIKYWRGLLTRPSPPEHKSNQSLYLLEGIMKSGNYAALHLSSTRIDEPRCLQLLSVSDHVVTIHGCSGGTPEVQIGGLDTDPKLRIRGELAKSHVSAVIAEGRFAARQQSNICNRGRRAIGVQLELSRGLRLSGDTEGVVTAVRAALLG